ncbi:hypothetical protein HJ590_15765 [Naumannella sp. ID2617S]|nr:hypothetical protein [Naumannella sp. ID2617S]
MRGDRPEPPAIPPNPVLTPEQVEFELDRAMLARQGAAHENSRTQLHVEGAAVTLPMAPGTDPYAALRQLLPEGQELLDPTGRPSRIGYLDKHLKPVLLIAWAEPEEIVVAAYAVEGLLSMHSAHKVLQAMVSRRGRTRGCRVSRSDA